MSSDLPGFNRVTLDGIDLYYKAASLGVGVAENITRLVKLYADRAGLREIPPVTLGAVEPEQWAKPWPEIAAWPRFLGNAGPSYNETRAGVDDYRCLALDFDRSPEDDPAHPQGIEGTIAHEITHLRWWNLKHGSEFDARVRALLRGAVFPAGRGGWSKKTQAIMRETRAEVAAWLERLLARK